MEKSVKVIQDWPPNIEDIKRHWGYVSPETVFTFAPNIYCPSTDILPPDIQIHEEHHIKQQGDNPESYCMRYLNDPQFRYDSELEAYAVQLNWIRKECGVNAADEAIFEYAKNLSSIYHLDIPYEKAEVAIRQLAKKLRKKLP